MRTAIWCLIVALTAIYSHTLTRSWDLMHFQLTKCHCEDDEDTDNERLRSYDPFTERTLNARTNRNP